jgi:hypothetical protein
MKGNFWGEAKKKGAGCALGGTLGVMSAVAGMFEEALLNG